MTLPGSEISTFRAQWADRFVDTITVTRLTDRGAFNDATLQYDGPASSTVYTGGALIRPRKASARPLVGEQAVTLSEYSVFVPHDAGGFAPEDLITVDTAVHDTVLAGLTFRVLTAEVDTWKTRIHLVARLDEGPGYAD